MNIQKDILAKSFPKETLFEHTQAVIDNVEVLKRELDGKLNVSDKEKFWELLKIAGLVHDFGKIQRLFQKRLHGDNSNKDEKEYYHSILSGGLVKWYKVTNRWRRIFISSIVLHHYRDKIVSFLLGKDENIAELFNYVKNNYNDFREILEKEFKDKYSKLLEEYLANEEELVYSSRYKKEILLPENMVFMPGNFSMDLDDEYKKDYVIFKGLLMRADHFASAKSALKYRESKDLLIEINPLEEEKVIKSIEYCIKEKTKKEIKIEELWQYRVLQESKNKNIILVGSTGIGKSEFAFLWGAGQKLIITLPMRTMGDQLYKRAKNIFGENVGLLHSTSEFTIKGSKDDEKKDVNVDSIKENSKHLAYPVLVATGDQIFTVALKYAGYETLLSTLSYSYTVIDEVQAYDPIASAIIVKTIEDINKMGGKFLLMTATLPGYIKREIKDRVKGVGSVEEGSNVKEFYRYHNTDDEEICKHKIYLEETDSQEISGFIEYVKEKIKSNEGKSVLIIANTVNNAQEVFRKLKEEYKEKYEENALLLLHSRFKIEDKDNIVKAITQEDNKKKPDILITTQIVEASVDIDYDILITEVAPLESLIQRMGRVFRNRQNYDEKGEIYIWGGITKGSNFVYLENDTKSKEGYKLIEKTIEVLRNYNAKEIKEKEKQELLEQYYENPGKIAEDFTQYLNYLDMIPGVERKKQAQKMFRDISAIDIILESDIEAVSNWIKDNLKKAKEKIKTLLNSEIQNKEKQDVKQDKWERVLKEIKDVWDLPIDEALIKQEYDREKFLDEYSCIIGDMKKEVIGYLRENSFSVQYYEVDLSRSLLEVIEQVKEEVKPLDYFKGILARYYINSNFRYDPNGEGLAKIYKDEKEYKEVSSLII